MNDEQSDWQRHVGVGEPSRAFLKHRGGSRRRPVITEEGPTRGTVGGHHTDHWDGRVDATVTPAPVKIKAKYQED